MLFYTFFWEVRDGAALHARVRDCGVFGIPDDEFGETLWAHIEPDPKAPVAGEITAFLRERLADFKVPR